jgi:hypothetical protein
MVFSPERAGLLVHHGSDAVGGEDDGRALGHLVGLVDEDRTALLASVVTTCLLCTISLRT